ncbi:MAG: hypothetical protein H7A39_06005 [Chlamydiales bacterium]|nr:hypothetical protein [Chlamydiales bacterium]
MVLNLAKINSDKSPIKSATNGPSQDRTSALIDSIMAEAEEHLNPKIHFLKNCTYPPEGFDGFKFTDQEFTNAADENYIPVLAPQEGIDAIPAPKQFTARTVLLGLIAIAAIVTTILLMIALSPIGL